MGSFSFRSVLICIESAFLLHQLIEIDPCLSDVIYNLPLKSPRPVKINGLHKESFLCKIRELTREAQISREC
jgi:hypothetical protein